MHPSRKIGHGLYKIISKLLYYSCQFGWASCKHCKICLDDLLSRVPKVDSKIVQTDLLGVAVVFFSFISWLQICCFLFIFKYHSASILIAFVAWLEHFCSSLVPSGSKCFSTQSDWLNKQANKQTCCQLEIMTLCFTKYQYFSMKI